jgi:hypothetical protein
MELKIKLQNEQLFRRALILQLPKTVFCAAVFHIFTKWLFDLYSSRRPEWAGFFRLRD